MICRWFTACLLYTALSASLPAGSAADSLGFVFPDSDREKLYNFSLRGLSSHQMQIARNEIFARHGYTFRKAALREYFGTKTWYAPRSDFDPAVLTEVEKWNVDRLRQLESKLAGSKPERTSHSVLDGGGQRRDLRSAVARLQCHPMIVTPCPMSESLVALSVA